MTSASIGSLMGTRQSAAASPAVATDRAIAVLARLTFIALLLVPMMRRPAKPAQTATETH